MMYVRYPMLVKHGGVILSQSQFQLLTIRRDSNSKCRPYMTIRKLKIQFAVVAIAFAGARIDSGVISAG